MTLAESELHVRGQSRYIDDLPAPEGCLHAAVVDAAAACGTLRGLDTTEALGMAGVRGILTARDVPGENQIGNILQDEVLLVETEVHFRGQPVALVVADTPEAARAAARRVKVDIVAGEPLFDPREAAQRGLLIAPPRVFALGDVDAAWAGCAVMVEGRAESGGQEHLYLETQSALAIPEEGGGIRLHSSTQAPTVVQRIVARVLGLAMHQVEVDTARLGGGFGGKEDQATAWAALAALAASRLHRPVKLVLRRHEDLRMTGKRHPYASDFRLGLDAEGRFVAYEVTYYQDAGAAADLSTSILERTLFHATNSYFVPNVRATGFCCRTNHVPNTAFRGFGGPQAMFVMECAIDKAAQALGCSAHELQARNLLASGDEFPYGQRLGTDGVRTCWRTAVATYRLDELREGARRFNATHALVKQGVAAMPVCFGIAFTATFLNQASALVHVYTDGSVGVSTGAVEMGQGVSAKIRHVVAQTLGVDMDRVKVETTNTTRVANASPTAASSDADLNGNAARLACRTLRERLDAVASGRPDVGWCELVREAYRQRVSLSAQAHYATPRLSFDPATAKGDPFAYHVTGTCITEVTVDVLRGTYRVDAVHVVHELGRSLNEAIDRGQIEGGLLQGIGWVTTEELRYGADGRLQTDTLTTYKVPDIHAAPRRFDITFLDSAEPNLGLLGAKTVGEPPFMYGIGTYFALLDALRAFRPQIGAVACAPLTPERVLMLLHGDGGGA